MENFSPEEKEKLKQALEKYRKERPFSISGKLSKSSTTSIGNVCKGCSKTKDVGTFAVDGNFYCDDCWPSERLNELKKRIDEFSDDEINPFFCIPRVTVSAISEIASEDSRYYGILTFGSSVVCFIPFGRGRGFFKISLLMSPISVAILSFVLWKEFHISGFMVGIISFGLLLVTMPLIWVVSKLSWVLVGGYSAKKEAEKEEDRNLEINGEKVRQLVIGEPNCLLFHKKSLTNISYKHKLLNFVDQKGKIFSFIVPQKIYEQYREKIESWLNSGGSDVNTNDVIV